MVLNKYSKAAVGMAVLAGAVAFGSAQAATISVDVSGIESYGAYDDPNNYLLDLLIGANAAVTGVSYDVNLTANSPSWLSEIAVDFTDSGITAGVGLRPGFEVNAPGTGSFSESLNLLDFGLGFNVGADGILHLQFYDGFDDGGAPDGRWNSGTLTFEVSALAVPEPSTYALMAFGVAGLGLFARRRKAA